MKKLRLAILLLGSLLLIGGAVFTGVAVDIAESDGYDLFTAGQDMFRLDLAAGDVQKLSFSVLDTEVCLRSDRDRSYVEIANLSPDAYSLSFTDGTLTFREKNLLNPFLDFGSGSSFQGLRRLFRIGASAHGTRRVYVYLSPYDTAVKEVSVDGTHCSVTAGSLVNPCDINVYGEKSATFSADALLSQSMLTLRGNRVSLSLRDSALSFLTVMADRGNVSANGLSFTRLDLSVSTGTVRIGAFGQPDRFSLQISEGKGTVRLDEKILSRPLMHRTEDGAGSIRISSEKGNFTLWFTGDEVS